MFNLRFIFTGPMLEKEIQRLSENLVREQRAREADKAAWDRRYDNLRVYYQTRLDALSDRMLLMAGIPTNTLVTKEVEEYEQAHTPPPAVPGAASAIYDEFLEDKEEAYLKAYWEQLKQGSLGDDQATD